MITDDQLRDFSACLARREGDALECEVLSVPRTKLFVIEGPESITRTNHPSHPKALEALRARLARRVSEGWTVVPAPLRLRSGDGAECALWLPLDGVVRVDREGPSCTVAGDDFAAIRAYNAALAGLRAEGFAVVLAPTQPALASRGRTGRGSERLTEALTVEGRFYESTSVMSQTLLGAGRPLGSSHEFTKKGELVRLVAHLEGSAHGLCGCFADGALEQLARNEGGRLRALRSVGADGSLAHSDDGFDASFRKRGLWMHWIAPQNETLWQRVEGGVVTMQVTVPGAVPVPSPMPERVETGVVRRREGPESEVHEERFRGGVLEARKEFAPDGKTLLLESKGGELPAREAPEATVPLFFFDEADGVTRVDLPMSEKLASAEYASASAAPTEHAAYERSRGEALAAYAARVLPMLAPDAFAKTVCARLDRNAWVRGTGTARVRNAEGAVLELERDGGLLVSLTARDAGGAEVLRCERLAGTEPRDEPYACFSVTAMGAARAPVWDDPRRLARASAMAPKAPLASVTRSVDVGAALARIEAARTGAPSRAAFVELCALFAAAEPDEAEEKLLSPLRACTAAWPASMRAAPLDWIYRWTSGALSVAAFELVSAVCAGPMLHSGQGDELVAFFERLPASTPPLQGLSLARDYALGEAWGAQSPSDPLVGARAAALGRATPHLERVATALLRAPVARALRVFSAASDGLAPDIYDSNSQDNFFGRDLTLRAVRESPAGATLEALDLYGQHDPGDAPEGAPDGIAEHRSFGALRELRIGGGRYPITAHTLRGLGDRAPGLERLDARGGHADAAPWVHSVDDELAYTLGHYWWLPTTPASLAELRVTPESVRALCGAIPSLRELLLARHVYEAGAAPEGAGPWSAGEAHAWGDASLWPRHFEY